MTSAAERSLSVGELSDVTGCSAHTIRYYDDAGLIPLVERTPAGHRRFRPQHASWIRLLGRLRASGMPIIRMREYADLAARGDETIEQRRVLLEQHRIDIRARIDNLQRCLAVVQAKIDLYEGRISDPRIVWSMVDDG